MPSIETNALETPLGKALYDHGMVDLADERPKESGKVFRRRLSRPDGLSVNVFSAKTETLTVNVFLQLSKGQPLIRFASYKRLARLLPDQREKLDAWADFIQEELGGDIRDLEEKKRCKVDLFTVEQHLGGLVAALWTLALTRRSIPQEC